MIRIRHPVLLTALLTVLLAVLAPVPASFAAQHVTQSLTPPPPSFLTCKAVGNGTICHGSRTFTIDPHPTSPAATVRSSMTKASSAR